jgi:uncharacterized protein (TIGR02246 family)
MRRKLWLTALSLLFIPAVARAQTIRAYDEKAIGGVETQWETAWNHHDIPGMVRLFALDADVINLAGQWFHSRDAFARSLETLHSAKVKESVWHTEQVKAEFLAANLAVVHVYFSTSGERNPDGSPMPPRRGIFTRVEAKRGGRWVILASQATSIVPPQTAGDRGGAEFEGSASALAELHP